MEKGRFNTLSFLIRIVLLLHLTYFINLQCGAEAISQSKIYERMSKIEAQNQQHEKEISLLKTERVEDKNEIHKLRNRVARLEASSAFDGKTNEHILGRQKRPYRLIPKKLPNNNKKEEAPDIESFYGPPTSCRELGALGYTLNGYYLVKGENELKTTKIQTVYCQFKQLHGMKRCNVLETRIGIVDVKSSLVQFDVEGINLYNAYAGKKIRYNRKSLNVGNGFNLENGWFQAPYPGTYFFSISVTKGTPTSDKRTCIEVQINGNWIGEAISSDYTSYGGFSYQFTRKLNATDKIELFLKIGKIPYSIYFTGWMLDEGLLI